MLNDKKRDKDFLSLFIVIIFGEAALAVVKISVFVFLIRFQLS